MFRNVLLGSMSALMLTCGAAFADSASGTLSGGLSGDVGGSGNFSTGALTSGSSAQFGTVGTQNQTSAASYNGGFAHAQGGEFSTGQESGAANASFSQSFSGVDASSGQSLSSTGLSAGSSKAFTDSGLGGDTSASSDNFGSTTFKDGYAAGSSNFSVQGITGNADFEVNGFASGKAKSTTSNGGPSY